MSDSDLTLLLDERPMSATQEPPTFLPSAPGAGGAMGAPGMQIPGAPATPAVPMGEDLLKMIWRRRWLVIGITILFIGIAIAYLSVATRLYTGYARLYIEQVDPVVINDGRGIPQRSKNYLYTQCEMIVSAPILSKVLDLPEVKKMSVFEGVTDRMIFLKDSLGVDVGKKDDIIEISFDAADPKESAVLVNHVVDAYLNFQSGQKRSTANEVLKVLSQEKLRRENDLNAKMKEMIKYKQDNGTLSFEDAQKGNVIVQRLAQLSDALTAAQLKTVAAKTTYEAALAMAEQPAALKHLVMSRSTGSAYSAIDREADELTTQLAQLELRLNMAERQLSASHPSVQSARAAVDAVKVRVAERNKKYVAAYLTSAEQEWNTAKRAEEEIKTALADQQKQALDLNQKATQYAMLDADVKRMQRLGEALDQQMNNASLASNAGALDVQVVEKAVPADKPSKPRGVLTLGIFMVLGLMSGVGTALIRGWTDTRLQTTDQIQQTLGMPVLCGIPHIRNTLNTLARGQIVHLDPTSEAAEAYRTVRTAVDFHMRRAQAKSLLITSPSQGDGKSTLVSNLAIAMAQAGQRTLVIDADLRNPSIHAIFQATNGAGLSGILTRGEPIEKAINGTTIEGLELLPCGPIPANPAEILSSKPFAELLRLLTQRYDRILIDSPPVMPLADARSLAGLCDRTLLVLRAQKSTRRISEDTCAGLAGVGAQIMGVVVNDVYQREGADGFERYRNNGNGHGRMPRLEERIEHAASPTPASLPAPDAPERAWR